VQRNKLLPLAVQEDFFEKVREMNTQENEIKHSNKKIIS
jgi:hypothetical protein